MVVLEMEGALDMPLIGMFRGDPCPWPGRLGEGRGGDRWGRVGGSCLWRSWGGTETRRAQQPAALHPLCPSLLSVQRPRGGTRGCMPSLPASTGAHSEFQVPKPCTFTSLGSPAASQVVTFGSKGPSHPCSESLGGWGREEGGHGHQRRVVPLWPTLLGRPLGDGGNSLPRSHTILSF